MMISRIQRITETCEKIGPEKEATENNCETHAEEMSADILSAAEKTINEKETGQSIAMIQHEKSVKSNIRFALSRSIC